MLYVGIMMIIFKLWGGQARVENIQATTSEYNWTGKTDTSTTSTLRVQAYVKYIWLGTSDAPAKSTDHTIEGAEGAASGTVTASKNKVVVTGTYTNSTSETKIFKEIGVSTQASAGGNYFSILLSRSVFPEPVVIPAGESKSFTITIDFNKFADTVVTA